MPAQKKKPAPRKPRVIVWAAPKMGLSGKDLKNNLQKMLPGYHVLMVRSNSDRFAPRKTDVLVNWGNGNLPNWPKPYHEDSFAQVFNYPAANKQAINKLVALQKISPVCNTPEFTTDYDIARSWVRDDEDMVVARLTAVGFGGEGIVLCTEEDDIPKNAKLYTRYKKKKNEYRVHVLRDKVIDVSQKKKRIDFDGELNKQIRNLAGGWVYAREDIEVPDDLYEQAIKAVQALSLDFGAVDIIWNMRENKSYVLEVNTAPGLTGTTLECYATALAHQILAGPAGMEG